MNKLSKYFKKKAPFNGKNEHVTFTLTSGLKVVYKRANNGISHCGITIHTGSQEDGKHKGIAHFVEHMLFKGTQTKNSSKIINSVENLGGELNAFTDRQSTCIYSSIMTSYIEKGVTTLADIFQNSTFPKKEIEKERKVILDEIKIYEDSPEDVIFDEFYKLFFKKHSLGSPILGTKLSVKKINKEHLLEFYNNHYRVDNAVFSYVGDLPKKELKKVLEKAFKIKATNTHTKRKTTKSKIKVSTFNKSIKQDFSQSYKVIGYPAYSYNDKRKYTMALISNMLGGPSLNSILNMRIREKEGLIYQIDTSYSSYRDLGLFTIFFNTDQKNIKRVTQLVQKEINKIKNKVISAEKLNKIKRQFIGQSIMYEENNCSLMISMGKEMALFGQITTPDMFLKIIEGISPQDVHKTANEIFCSQKKCELFF